VACRIRYLDTELKGNDKNEKSVFTKKRQGVVMLKQWVRLTFTTCMLAVLCYTNIALGHGNASMEEDSCIRQVGENFVHLNIYQPQLDRSGHYCTEIPAAGEAYLVVDLIDAALRDMPVGIKVFKGTDTKGEAAIQVNATHHPDGVVNGIGWLDKGIYSVVVTAEGVPPLNFNYKLHVETIDYGKQIRTWAAPVIAFLFLSWALYKLIRSGRVKRWFRPEDE
jgi:hypothetical protein